MQLGAVSAGQNVDTSYLVRVLKAHSSLFRQGYLADQVLERAPHLEESTLPLATQVLNELTGAREIDTVALQLAAQVLHELTGVGDFDTASRAAYIRDFEERLRGTCDRKGNST